MSPRKDASLILMADDDPGDRLLASEALKQSGAAYELQFVEDGEELLEYLRHQGRYAPPAHAPLPRLILLDLNMPRKTGLEALQEIKADPNLRRIPTVVLTTSHAPMDIRRSYEIGANAFISKPVAFDDLVLVMESLREYWMETVQVSSHGEPRTHGG